MWFGNAVPPWVAEGAAVYANCRYLAKFKGPNAGIELLDREFYPSFASPEVSAAPLITTTGVLRYSRGGYLLGMLERQAGEDSILGALRGFEDSSARGNRVDIEALSEEFIRRLKQVAGAGLEQFVDDWTRTVKRFDPAIVAVRPYVNGGGEVQLRHFGEIRFPVPVSVCFADGTKRELIWDSPEERKTLKVDGSVPLASAEIDVRHVLLTAPSGW